MNDLYLANLQGNQQTCKITQSKILNNASKGAASSDGLFQRHLEAHLAIDHRGKPHSVGDTISATVVEQARSCLGTAAKGSFSDVKKYKSFMEENDRFYTQEFKSFIE